ncbi:MAG: YgiQ family radical SAM protein, partial [Candidatus Zixiibacteriota bacterium]
MAAVLNRKTEGAIHPLPVSAAEMHFRGWGEVDILIVTGDSYIDHPFIEAALVGRVMEAAGFRVGILPQPDWKSAEAFTALGKPKLFYLITAGNLDSMAANYTPSRSRQKEDPYSHKGHIGLRPDRASLVYAHRAREGGGGVPVILFGLEASLRRLSYYDFWEERVRRPILFDAKADMVIYGPPERTAVELARRIKEGEKIGDIRDLPGTASKQKRIG